jgi:ABC-2 type transport system ATP-binding protein
VTCAFHTENLTKVFGAFTAVDGISFDVEKGEVFGLLGPNGAGKTTTIKMLCTLLLT